MEELHRANRVQRVLDMEQLRDASEAVESLRSALSASAAAEEAARLEVSGLKLQLTQFREEEDARFSATLRQQAELMKLQKRIAALTTEGAELRAVSHVANANVAVLRCEVERAEAEASTLKADLRAFREQAAAQLKAVSAAREREGAEHASRLGVFQRQLAGVREAMTQQLAVDARQYLDIAEPLYKKLREGVEYELSLASQVGRCWETAEVEMAREEAAAAQGRLDDAVWASRRDRAAREDAIREERRLLTEAHAEQMGSLREQAADAVLRLQEAEVSARAAQQRMLEEMRTERDSFQRSLRSVQQQSASLRRDVTRMARGRDRLVLKLAAASHERGLSRIVHAWRGLVVVSQLSTARAAQGAVALRARADLTQQALQTWVHAALRSGWVRWHAWWRGSTRAATAGSAGVALDARRSRLQSPSRSRLQSPSRSRLQSPSRPRSDSSRSGATGEHPTAPRPPAGRGAQTDEGPGSCRVSDGRGGGGPALGTAHTSGGPAAKERLSPRTRRRHEYVEYLEACLRQHRQPAVEVVEIARQIDRERPPLFDSVGPAASLLARQRELEVQLGVAVF